MLTELLDRLRDRLVYRYGTRRKLERAFWYRVTTGAVRVVAGATSVHGFGSRRLCALLMRDLQDTARGTAFNFDRFGGLGGVPTASSVQAEVDRILGKHRES